MRQVWPTCTTSRPKPRGRPPRPRRPPDQLGRGFTRRIGSRVAISADGTTAFIGAYGVSTGTGVAYVFHVSSEGSWATTSTPTATLTNSSGASGDLFGTSVALSADGTTAVIGAPGVTGRPTCTTS